jgi:hypothetical protein
MLTRTRRLMGVAGVLALALTNVPSASAIGGNAHKTMYLTFSGPVRLPGVSLGTGTYIFEMDPSGVLGVVQVLSRDRSRVYYTGLTNGIDRPAGMDPAQVASFGEAPRTEAPPVTVWWPQDTPRGRQFIYPDRR